MTLATLRHYIANADWSQALKMLADALAIHKLTGNLRGCVTRVPANARSH